MHLVLSFARLTRVFVIEPPAALECGGLLDIWLLQKCIYESYHLYKRKSISPQIKSEPLLCHSTVHPGFARLVLLQLYDLSMLTFLQSLMYR